MSIFLRISLLIGSLLTCAYTARKLKKAQMQVTDTIYWIGMSALFLLLSIFPQIAVYASEVLGFQATVNFIFLLMIFLLFIRCFLLSIRVSQLDAKLRNLIEELAIRENQKKDL